MIIVDVETTGVDARLCSLLSVGAVEFEHPRNQFYKECYAFPGAHVEKEALVISGFTMEEITANHQSPITNHQSTPSQSPPLKRGIGKTTDKRIVEQFLEWMKTCTEWTLAGQNPSFDRSFLEETAHRYHINWPLAHRTLDLHSIAYYHMKKRGIEPPQKNNHSALNLDRILKYVGLPTRAKKHNALEDAKLEAEALSRLLYDKNLLPEYSALLVPKI